MKSNMSRREFLRLMALAGSAAGLAACAPKIIPTVLPTVFSSDPGMSTASPTPAIHTEGGPTAVMEATTTPAANYPHLVVARNGDPETMVQRAIAALGGMEKFVPRDANVIIKPNMCVAYHTYEYAATTNPWVVGALVKMAYAAGAKTVRVYDFPFGGTAAEAYARSGIEEQVKAAGGEMIPVQNYKFISTELPNAKALKSPGIYDDILKADVLINVPIAKHHSLAVLTVGMKNLMGVVLDRPSMHWKMGDNLTDLAEFLKPKMTLTVVDAVRMLMDNGPSGGDLNDVKEMNTIVASADVVSTDAYTSTLFGKSAEALDYVRVAAERGLGIADLNSIKIEEINVGA